MLTCENWKRLEDTLTDYVCDVYNRKKEWHEIGLSLAINMLKALHASNWQVDEDEAHDVEEDSDAYEEEIKDEVKKTFARLGIALDSLNDVIKKNLASS